MKIAVTGMLLAASLAVPATAHADDVPSADQVVVIMAELTDPNIPAANKSNIVAPPFTADEAATLDDQLHQIEGKALPLPFIVTNIQPAPDNSAGATVETGGNRYQHTWPTPVVLVEQDGHWKITHDSAMPELDEFWRNGTRPPPHAVFTR